MDCWSHNSVWGVVSTGSRSESGPTVRPKTKRRSKTKDRFSFRMRFGAPSQWYRYAVLALCVLSPRLAAQEDSQPSDFAETVRRSEPLSPGDQRQTFTLPDGFEVQLFASEPEIQKPLNMAFDADGRLWVTGSNSYPHPAAEAAGSDTIRVLEDTTGDGVADRITTFADDLNIPMGIYPWRDGCVVFSIPNILFLRDTDGDGKADSRTVLYGPFDTTRDTHGMNNAFRRGYDGWLYCCHGFNNQSVVKGSDGHEVRMNSGNTYRIRLDGSRIEHITHGQVNPFGMTIDAFGDHWNSDCHTKPVTLLLKDGYYESFGKPHDGLGFVPPVMDHLHGSTAIDGLCQYQGTAFPLDYQDDLFVGNVMTSRVHRNSIIRIGSTVRMKEEEDFMVSSDSWFRPVDIQIGPDGALYVADFYNRIIGHYEVPLDHPGRDQFRGRIWRIAYVGRGDGSTSSETVSSPRLGSARLTDLLQALNQDSKPVRQHAADQIVDRIGSEATADVQARLAADLKTQQQTAAPQLIWILHRLNAMDGNTLTTAFENGNQRTRVHVMRSLAEFPERDSMIDLIKKGMRDNEGLVRRATAHAASSIFSVDVAKEVVNALVVCPQDDVHQQHALRIALKAQLSQPDILQWFSSATPPPSACEPLASVLTAIDSSAASGLGILLLNSSHLSEATAAETALHTAEHLNADTAVQLFEFLRGLPPESSDLATKIWLKMNNTFGKGHVAQPDGFQIWSLQLAQQTISDAARQTDWGIYRWAEAPAARWATETRATENDVGEISVISSLPAGEEAVGLLRSRVFVLPLSLQVVVCGHLGRPTEAAIPDNRIVLRDADTGQQIDAILAPRTDKAQTLAFRFGRFAGRNAYLEVVDGISRGAYAWIAIGSTEPRVVRSYVMPADQSELVASSLDILSSQQANGKAIDDELLATVAALLPNPQTDGIIREKAAAILLSQIGATELLPLTELLADGRTSRKAVVAIVQYCQDAMQSSESDDVALVRTVMLELPAKDRGRLAIKLASTREGAELLLAILDQQIARELLRDGRLSEQIAGFDQTFRTRVGALIESLPPADADFLELEQRTLIRLRLGDGDKEAGRTVYQKNCQSCHKIQGQGGLAGPQLDGIGSRSDARILEDILYPNRNADRAFRASVVTMLDGRVMTGIIRDSDARLRVNLVNTDGKVLELERQDIDEIHESKLSLMPGNLATSLTEQELLDVLTFLAR